MMVGNALLVTIAILLGYLFWLMGELKFIAPYKVVLFHAYGNIALGCGADPGLPSARPSQANWRADTRSERRLLP
jgi:hypothetical protein